MKIEIEFNGEVTAETALRLIKYLQEEYYVRVEIKEDWGMNEIEELALDEVKKDFNELYSGIPYPQISFDIIKFFVKRFVANYKRIKIQNQGGLRAERKAVDNEYELRWKVSHGINSPRLSQFSSNISL